MRKNQTVPGGMQTLKAALPVMVLSLAAGWFWGGDLSESITVMEYDRTHPGMHMFGCV